MKTTKPLTPAKAAAAGRAARRLQARKRQSDIAAAAWQWMQVNANGLTVDQLLCYPSMALRMCRAVGKRFKDEPSERVVCHALLSARKAGKFQSEKKKK